MSASVWSGLLRMRRTVGVLVVAMVAAVLAPLPASARVVPTAITVPSDGDTIVSSPMLVSADSEAAYVRFVAAGQIARTVPVSTGSAVTEIPVQGLDGNTSIDAYDCDTETTCADTPASITVDVDLKAPEILAPSRNDVVGSSVTVTVKTSWGGALRFFVDGLPVGIVSGSSTRLAKKVSLKDHKDGAHVLSVKQCNSDGSICDGATDSVQLIKDTKSPNWSDASALPSTVYPVKDGYKDSTTLSARVSEALRSAKVEIRKSGGPVVRTIKLGREDKGKVRAKWNGRKANGSIVPNGRYVFRFIGSDKAGLVGQSNDKVVNVSDKRLVKQTVIRTVSAKSSFYRNLSGACSGVYSLDYRQARYDWPKGVGYYSRSKCSGNANDDTALALHRAAAPKAVRYGAIRIDTYGGGAFRHAGPGAILYVKGNGDAGAGRIARQNLAWHSGPSVAGGAYVKRGRVLWAFGAVRGNWFDVKEFRLTFRISVLR